MWGVHVYTFVKYVFTKVRKNEGYFCLVNYTVPIQVTPPPSGGRLGGGRVREGADSNYSINSIINLNSTDLPLNPSP